MGRERPHTPSRDALALLYGCEQPVRTESPTRTSDTETHSSPRYQHVLLAGVRRSLEYMPIKSDPSIDQAVFWYVKPP